jgi:hypothetical protein
MQWIYVAAANVKICFIWHAERQRCACLAPFAQKGDVMRYASLHAGSR